jgi:hypothetical protein
MSDMNQNAQRVFTLTPEDHLGDVIAQVNFSKGLLEKIGEKNNMRSVAALLPTHAIDQFP